MALQTSGLPLKPRNESIAVLVRPIRNAEVPAGVLRPDYVFVTNTDNP